MLILRLILIAWMLRHFGSLIGLLLITRKILASRREAECLMLTRQDAELRAQHAAKQPQSIQFTQQPNVGLRSPKQCTIDLMTGEQLATSALNQNDNNRQNASSKSNLSSSSIDSGSSSSDPDIDSSSSDESEAAKSS